MHATSNWSPECLWEDMKDIHNARPASSAHLIRSTFILCDRTRTRAGVMSFRVAAPRCVRHGPACTVQACVGREEARISQRHAANISFEDGVSLGMSLKWRHNALVISYPLPSLTSLHLTRKDTRPLFNYIPISFNILCIDETSRTRFHRF